MKIHASGPRAVKHPNERSQGIAASTDPGATDPGALSRYSEACQAGPHMVNRYVNLLTYAAAMNPAEFERFRADLTDMGRQLLNQLLMLSPHQHHRSTT